MRNFFGLIAVTYDRKKQGETLEDVIAAVAENFRRELTKEKLEKMIAGQVSLEKHMAARAIPLIFKDIGMELSGLIAGARQTMYFSNIGHWHHMSVSLIFLLDVPEDKFACVHMKII